jgi:hypothetical protein
MIASRNRNTALLMSLAVGAGLVGAVDPAPAQVVIGNWEELVTPPPPDPDPLPPDFHRPIGSSGTEGWVDWQNRGIYSSATFGATNGTKSLRMLTADDGGSRWMQGLTLPVHVAGHVGAFLASGQFAIDVSWRESEWVGGEWSQVENLYVNSPSTGFVGRGRATDDTHNDPPWNGSWDVTNFDDNTRTLTWDMQDLIDGDAANGEISTVPAPDGGGWLELILASNYDDAFNPATAAFYFDNARLLPRVTNSEWKGGAPDPDNNAGNGNAATNLWYASQNWISGVPGFADSTALFGTNGGVLVDPQTVNANALVTLGGMTFDNAAGYTIGGTGSIALDVSASQSSISVNAGNHAVNLPLTLADNTSVTVTPPGSVLTLVGPVTGPNRSLTKAGAGRLDVGRFNVASLAVDAGTVRTLAGSGTSRVQELTIAGGSSPTAQLDITDNALVVDYTGATPFETIRAQVVSGYAGGSWNGNGIVSSSANGSTHGVGYAESSDIFTSFPATFAGESVDDTAVLLRFARYGDANIDGTVNLQDFNRLASNFGTASGADWSQGDFNYDGVVNLQDFNRLAANFGRSAGPDGVVDPDDWAALAAVVPEPGAAGSIIFVTVAALARRRRRS